MKNSRKVIAAGTLMLSALLIMGPVSALAESQVNQENINEMYREEIYAKTMYEKMVEKFDNDDYYQRLIRAETNHSNAAKRLMDKNNIPVVDNKVEVKVADDELTALKAAYEYEVKDVETLDELIKNTENPDEIRVYERLKAGSERHAKSLERAIGLYEEGKTKIAENMTGGQNKAGRGRNNNSSSEGNRGMNNPDKDGNKVKMEPRDRNPDDCQYENRQDMGMRNNGPIRDGQGQGQKNKSGK